MFVYVQKNKILIIAMLEFRMTICLSFKGGEHNAPQTILHWNIIPRHIKHDAQSMLCILRGHISGNNTSSREIRCW